MTAELTTGPSHGSVTLNADGGFTYTPAANYFGTDEFWYRGYDGQSYSAATRVALTINPVNDAPTAAGLPPVSVAEDASATALTLTDHFADVEDGAAGLDLRGCRQQQPGPVSLGLGVRRGANADLRRERDGSATLTVRATDSGGLSVDGPCGDGDPGQRRRPAAFRH